MNQKFCQIIYHGNIDADLMEENEIQINRWIAINVDECKKRNVCEKDYVWNPATCSCENGKYLTSIMKDSRITCDEIIKSYAEEAKTIPTNFAEKKAIFIDYYSIIDSC